MKKLLLSTSLIFVSTLLYLSSCNQPQSDKPLVADSKVNALDPVSIDVKTKTTLEVLGVFNTKGGYLYVYKFGSDTIYWGEGKSSTYPVSIHNR